MHMIFKQLKLEFLRLFGIKRNLIIFLLFTIISLFFVYSGTVTYKNTEQEKELFSQNKGAKSKPIVRDDHYSSHEFRILQRPAAINIFFTNSGIFENLYATVDLFKEIDIDSSLNGRNLFYKKGFFKDMAGFFFLFGSLLMIYFGMTSHKPENPLYFFSGTVIRLLLLELAVSILLAGLFWFPGLLNVTFSSGDFRQYLFFCVYLLVFLAFFYGLGLLVRTLMKQPSFAYLTGLAVWFVCIAVIPEVMTIHLQNQVPQFTGSNAHHLPELYEWKAFQKDLHSPKEDTGALTQAERKKVAAEKTELFLKKEYLPNTEREKKRYQDVKNRLLNYENLSMVFPTAFYPFLSSELSGQGYWDYLDLVDETLTLRLKVITCLVQSKYQFGGDGSSAFIKDNETILISRDRLPRRYGIAVGIHVIYLIALFLASYLTLAARSKSISQLPKPGNQFREGNTYFILCKDDNCKKELFHAYQTDPSVRCVGNIPVWELDLGIKPVDMADYYCRASGADREKFELYLSILGVPSLSKVPRNLYSEVTQAIYWAAIAAGNGDTIVIDNLLKGKSWGLERRFLQLLIQLNEEHKRVIYLSCDIFLTSFPFEGNIEIDSYKSFKIDPQVVRLR